MRSEVNALSILEIDIRQFADTTPTEDRGLPVEIGLNDNRKSTDVKTLVNVSGPL
jgi:hypothetical protein